MFNDSQIVFRLRSQLLSLSGKLRRSFFSKQSSFLFSNFHIRSLKTEAPKHLKEHTKMSYFSEKSLSFIRSVVSQVTVKGKDIREKACLKAA